MKEDKKTNVGLIVLIVAITVVAMIGGFILGGKFFDLEKSLDPAEKDNNQTEKVNTESTYTLDTYNADDNDRRVYYENGQLNLVDPNFEETQKVALNDVVSLGLNCDCGACRSIYYLNSNKELYEIKLDHGEFLLDDNNALDPDSVTKVAESVVGFKMIDISTLDDSDTCGGYTPQYKTTTGEVKTLNY